jgi:hypothetical protein
MLPISQSGEPGIQADRKQPRPLNFQSRRNRVHASKSLEIEIGSPQHLESLLKIE